LYSACKCNYYFSLFTFHFKAWLFQALNGVLILDDLYCALLACAGGDELELCLVAEVLEPLAGNPFHIDLLDVGGGEGIGGLGSLGVEFGVEASEFSEVDFLAFENQLMETIDGLGDDGSDVCAVVGAAVVGDVLGELLEVEDLAHLRGGISLGFGDVFLLGAGLGTHDDDTVVNHGFWGD